MSQELVPAFKRTIAPDVASMMQTFAYCYVAEARHDWRKAAKLCAITPMHARRIIETQPEWARAVDDVLKGLVVEQGSPKLRAIRNLSDMISANPQAELLAIPQPWTREKLDDGLSDVAKACIKSMKWRGIVDEFGDDVEVLDAIQWADRPWESTLRVLDLEGVRGLKLVPVDADREELAGFGGIQITFIEAPVD